MKIRIVNHRKFRSRIILIVFILSCIVFNIKNSVSSEEKIEYKTITVANGDTLWSIAKEEQETNQYYEKNDIREIISNIKVINNLNSSDLCIEQNLKIPVV